MLENMPLMFYVFRVGNYYYMTHWDDMINRTAVLTVENAAFANQGIYSASYVGDSPLGGAWMRLIVRGLLDPDIDTQKHTHAGICTVRVRLYQGFYKKTQRRHCAEPRNRQAHNTP